MCDMKKEKVGIFKSLKLLWKLMGVKERTIFVCFFAFSWVSAIARMFFNLVPPLVLASLVGEPVKLLFIDMSNLSTLAITGILLGINFGLWILGMIHYYVIDIFARRMICVVSIKAQDLLLAKRKNLDYGMTIGEVNYIVQNATGNVYDLIEPFCWRVITNLLSVVINIVVLFMLDYTVGILGIGMILGIFLIILMRLKLQNPVVERIEETSAKVNNQILTTAQNLSLITMLRSNLEETRQLGFLNEIFYRHHKTRAKIGFWYWIAIIGFEYLSIGLAVWLFISRNGTAMAVASITMIFTILSDTQATIENWGWEIGNIQSAAIKLCNLEKLNPTKENIRQAQALKSEAIEAEQITKLEVLDMEVSLGKFRKTYEGSFESGKIYLISGQSGCGKTTFVNALCGLKEVKSGQILVNGKYPLTSLADYSNKISYMFQDTILFDRSIEKNLCYPEESMSDEGKRLVVEFDMEKLILREKSGKDVRTKLSGGEKKRIDLIRALSRDADIYLLDEPTNELDEGNVQRVLAEVEKLKARKKIVIVISHDSRIEKIADEVLSV